nr:Glycosyl transferase family 2 [uncultured organism]
MPTSPALKPARRTSAGAPTPDAAIELSIVMPCLNEAETLAVCIRKAQAYLRDAGIAGEVVVADNGSSDGSRQIANALGARLIGIERRGYGAALLGGIAAARGRYVIMGDADDSYDFSALGPFVEALRAGGELVMGNRFLGGIDRGAMPPLHRYLGNPVLSFLGRRFFNSGVGDFHCGLRGFRRDAILALGLRSPGMEFASEMVVKSVLHRLDVRQVPTTLARDGRSRPPHLRTWRDGWRHLRFLLTYAPRYLFLYPGLALAGIGALGVGVLATGSVEIGGIELSATTMLFAAMAVLLGSQLIGFGVLARLYGVASNLWPGSASVERFRARFSVERGCIAGGLLVALGLAGTGVALVRWGDAGFGAMEPVRLMRLAIPAMLGTVLGLQTVFTSFLIGLIDSRQD